MTPERASALERMAIALELRDGAGEIQVASLNEALAVAKRN